MLRWALALLMVAAPALAQSRSDDEEIGEYRDGVIEEDPAYALEGRVARGERGDAPAVFVRLAEPGVVQVRSGDAWKDVTLAGLSDIVARARDEDIKAQVESGVEELPGGGRVPRLFVSIDVDPNVPWQHVQWVVTMVMEQSCANVELREGETAVLVTLPRNSSICPAHDYRPPPVLKATVHVLARNEQPAKWGDTEVPRPSEVRFRCGRSESADLADVASYLRRMKRAAEEAKEGPRFFYGEIKAGRRVPWSRVFEALEAIAAAEIPAMDTGETFVSIPARSVREAERLPYPAREKPKAPPPEPPTGSGSSD